MLEDRYSEQSWMEKGAPFIAVILLILVVVSVTMFALAKSSDIRTDRVGIIVDGPMTTPLDRMQGQ